MSHNNPVQAQGESVRGSPDHLSNVKIPRPSNPIFEQLNFAVHGLLTLYPVLSSGDISASPSEKRRESIRREQEEVELGYLQPVGAFRSTPVGLGALANADKELYQKVVALLSGLRNDSDGVRSLPNSLVSGEWFKFAAEDLGDALLLGDQGERASRNALYFSQQSIEKALKGLIILTSPTPIDARELRKHGHNLDLLLSSVAEVVDPTLIRVAEEIAVINPQSTRYRYPGAVEPSSPSNQETQIVFQAAKIAFREILDLALQQINDNS